jgi:hypothetical protein
VTIAPHENRAAVRSDAPIRDALAVADQLLLAGRNADACRVIDKAADALIASFRWRVDVLGPYRLRRDSRPGIGPRLVAVDEPEPELAGELLALARKAARR